jgi:hypothetical protein
MNSVNEIHKEIGLIKGRDGIYMDSLEVVDKTIKITGDINCQLCSIHHDARWIKFNLIFKQVIYHKLLEPECFSYISKYESNIAEEKGSELIMKYGIENKKHYIVLTYDYCLEVVASEIEMRIISKR